MSVSTTSTDRVRRHRQRKQDGMLVMFMLSHDEIKTLWKRGYLKNADRDQQFKVSKAAGAALVSFLNTPEGVCTDE